MFKQTIFTYRVMIICVPIICITIYLNWQAGDYMDINCIEQCDNFSNVVANFASTLIAYRELRLYTLVLLRVWFRLHVTCLPTQYSLLYCLREIHSIFFNINKGKAKFRETKGNCCSLNHLHIIPI